MSVQHERLDEDEAEEALPTAEELVVPTPDEEALWDRTLPLDEDTLTPEGLEEELEGPDGAPEERAMHEEEEE